MPRALLLAAKHAVPAAAEVGAYRDQGHTHILSSICCTRTLIVVHAPQLYFNSCSQRACEHGAFPKPASVAPSHALDTHTCNKHLPIRHTILF